MLEKKSKKMEFLEVKMFIHILVFLNLSIC